MTAAIPVAVSSLACFLQRMNDSMDEGRRPYELAHFALTVLGIVVGLIGIVIASVAVALTGLGLVFLGLLYFGVQQVLEG